MSTNITTNSNATTSNATTSLPLGFIAKIVAAPGQSDELAGLLTGALELANDEAGTVVWFAVRSDEVTFWIFDAFPTTEARDAHAGGAIVAALMANADRLLASPPEINPVDVLAMKLPN